MEKSCTVRASGCEIFKGHQLTIGLDLSGHTLSDRDRKDPAMGKLEGKIALVTGSNSGIGLATAKRFVCEGPYVFITGRRETELAAAAKEIGRNVTAVKGGVSKLDDLDRLFAQLKREKMQTRYCVREYRRCEFAALGSITEELFDSALTAATSQEQNCSWMVAWRKCSAGAFHRKEF